jgi:hypothetical protein
MASIIPERHFADSRRPPVAELNLPVTEVRRQYERAREYCGYTLDELINSSAAQRYLREIWLLGCMVRKPGKAAKLPPGNPFRTREHVAITWNDRH